jgi:hypothetical protein
MTVISGLTEQAGETFGGLGMMPALDLKMNLGDLENFFQTLGSGLSGWAETLSEGPYDPAMIEHIREMGNNIAAQGEHAAAAVTDLANMPEMPRLEDPRAHEEMLDHTMQDQ